MGRVMGIYNAALHLGLTLGPIAGIVFLRFLSKNHAFLIYSGLCFIGGLVIALFVHDVRPCRREKAHVKDLVLLAGNKKIFTSFFGIMLYGAGYGAFITVVPAFLMRVKSFGTSFTGIFFALFYIAISVSQIITGPRCDKFGRPFFMISGLLVAGVFFALFPFFEDVWVLMVLFIASLGLGVFYISSMAYIVDAVPGNLKGTVSGGYYLFWGAGYFFRPAISRKIDDIYGIGTSFYGYSALLVFTAFSLFLVFRDTVAVGEFGQM
jgi:MFS family permease